MAYKVTMSGHAREDLDRIIAYMAIELCNLPAAQAFAESLDRHIKLLEETPFMFSLCRDAELMQRGYHKALLGNYIMLYTVEENAGAVRIARLFYAREDYAAKI